MIHNSHKKNIKSTIKTEAIASIFKKCIEKINMTSATKELKMKVH